MKFAWRLEALQLAIILAMFVAAGLAWSHVPDRIPIHWNLRGEVDGYGGKVIGLLMLPALCSGMYLLLVVLPLFDPGRGNYQSFAAAYNVIRVSLVLFFATVDAVTLLIALGHTVDMNAVMPLAMGALFVVLGNFMSKLRPNWFVGVRTPWTLSSKLSWNKTHRLAGWLFIVMGLLMFLLGVIQTAWMFALTVSVCSVFVVWIIVYSYMVYRHDPQRTSPAGTSPGAP
jgi:uncharacterized membrane protein